MLLGADQKPRGLTAATIRLLWRPEVTIGAAFIALLLHKIKLMQTAANGPIVFAVVQHDTAIVALMVLLYGAGSAAVSSNNGGGIGRSAATMLSKLCIVVCLLVWLLYAADVLAYKFFATRLYASDVVTFSSDLRAAISMLRSGWWVVTQHPVWKLAIGAILMLLLLRACYVLLAKPVRSALRSRFLVAASLPLAIVPLLPVPSYFYTFTDQRLYANFIERNRNFFVRNTFSDAFRARILAAPAPSETCRPGRGRRLNLILVVVESLSAYHSRFFSGIEDWTPRLDEIAGRETALTNFYANGWTTAGGLVSLLTRTLPLVPELRTSRTKALTHESATFFVDHMDAPRPLPRVLSEQGYATEFVAPGDLTFLGQEQWLRTIGFQKIVKQDDARFAGQKFRGPFNSVPDWLLYNVALRELAQMDAERPYFMVVETFWSHQPFIDPNGGSPHREEHVIRETDKQIGAFYDRLLATGFFQNGLLFVTGDHRAMVPFRKRESERFGGSADARIPAVIATHAIDLPRVLAEDYQQRDLGASIDALVGGRYCLGSLEGAFLSDPPTPPTCIIHARGDDRDLIFVKCGTAEGTVRASGDATRFVSGAVPDEASIIAAINRTRVRK